MSLSYFASVCDLLRGISWPIAAIVIARAFKNQVPNLIERLRELGPTGAKFDAPQDQQRLISTDVSTATDLNATPQPSVSKAAQTFIQPLRTEIKAVDGDKKVEVLLNALAQSRLELSHERVYRNIFGSQIRALKHLNTVKFVGADEARSFFLLNNSSEESRKFYQNYGFEGWSGFLIANNLVFSENQKTSLTDVGRDFLLYMTGMGLSENKPW